MTEIYTKNRIFGKVGICDQSFHVCKKCGHGQLSNVIDVRFQYGDAASYNFRTSQSISGTKSADFVIDFLKSTIKNKHFETIIELGCNDMYILKALKNRAKKLIGIDPVLKGKEKQFSKGNITAIGDFFENVSLDSSMDIVICKDTLEHVDNPKFFTKKIVDAAHSKTLFFFHFPLLETLLSDYRFDQIFHQHLNYFSLQSIIYMLKDLGCELLNYTIDHNHWGAISILFKKGKNTQRFAKNVQTITQFSILKKYEVFKNSMINTNKQLKLLENERLYGYGAALMLPVLGYHLKNDFSSFECIIDDDPKKNDSYYINLPVKIRDTKKIKDIQSSTVLVTAISAISNTRKIITKLTELNPKKIIVPLNTF